MKKPTKGTMGWYRYVETKNMRLRSKLLKHTKKRKNETSHQWLRRLNKMYNEKKIKE